MEFASMSDSELLEAWMTLRDQVDTLDPHLSLGQDVPDESVRLLTDLNLAAKERVRRHIPAVDRRGSRFEVVREDGERERFDTRETAITRAVELGRVTRDI